MRFCSNPFPNYQFIINIPTLPKIYFGQKSGGMGEREAYIMFDRMEGKGKGEGRQIGGAKKREGHGE